MIIGQDVRKAFANFRESGNTKKESAGITPDLLFEESMVEGVYKYLASEINVHVCVEDVFGETSNSPFVAPLSDDQRNNADRDHYNTQYASAHLSSEQKIELLSKQSKKSLSNLWS